MKNIDHLVILDDREQVRAALSGIVGIRSYGEIIVRRQPLKSYADNLASLEGTLVLDISRFTSLEQILRVIEKFEYLPLTVLAGRGVPADEADFTEFLKRLQFLGKNFFDSEKTPLIAHFKTAKEFLRGWERFEAQPIHLQGSHWLSEVHVEKLDSFVDISYLEKFLRHVSRGTETRHFNELEITDYTYVKRSSDIDKLTAEFKFYYLLPHNMQPWFVQPYDFKVSGEQASYEMLRYHLADASLQWIHSAWSPQAFAAFLRRVMTFFRARQRKTVLESDALLQADSLFLDKLKIRSASLKDTLEGRKILSLLEAAGVSFNELVAQFEKLYQLNRHSFKTDVLCIGHGDPCLSNILYDQHHMVLKFIDPKGAISEETLWMHPLYDICKLSHSINGSYDFINHGLFQVSLAKGNRLELEMNLPEGLSELQQIFNEVVSAEGIDQTALKLGECSLFLSMPLLHLDHPNKALAFILNAKSILEELELHA